MTDLTHIRFDQWSITLLNEQISASKTPFVLVADQRIHLLVSEISELLNILKRDAQIAMVQPKIVVGDTQKFHPFGGVGGFTDRLGVGYTRGAAFGDSETDTGQYDTLNDDPDWIYAPVMLIRRESFQLACGIDTSFSGQMAWMDLGARLRRLGYRIDCYSSVVVSYPASISVSPKSDISSKLYPTVNFVIRHNDGPWVLVAMMWILLELMYVPGNLLQFRFKLVVSRLKATYSTLLACPSMIRDRYRVREGIEDVTSSYEPDTKEAVFSIFWNHFARLGKTASNLLTVFLVIASVFSLTMRDRR